VAAETVTASLMNTHVRDNDVYLKDSADHAPRVLSDRAGPITNSGSGETDMETYTVPGGTLARAGQILRYVVQGGTNNNTNSKTFKLKLGSTTFLTVTFTGDGSSYAFRIAAEVRRLSASNSLVATATMVAGPTPPTGAGIWMQHTSITEDTTGSLTLKMTAQGVASYDVTTYGHTLEVVPVA
jgi:hypothetical protein